MLKDPNNLLCHATSEKSANEVLDYLNKKIDEIGFASVYDFYKACNWDINSNEEEEIKNLGWTTLDGVSPKPDPSFSKSSNWWTVYLPPARKRNTIHTTTGGNKMGQNLNDILKHYLLGKDEISIWDEDAMPVKNTLNASNTFTYTYNPASERFTTDTIGIKEAHEAATKAFQHMMDCTYLPCSGFTNAFKKDLEDKKMRKALVVDDVITHNNKVVIVKFSDGSFTKSVCSNNDTFDLDVGISICCLKKLMSTDPKASDANKVYNNFMRKVHKKMDKKQEEKEEALKAKKERRDAQAAKKAKKDSRRQDQRHEFICDVADAIRKAESDRYIEEMESRGANFRKDEK